MGAVIGVFSPKGGVGKTLLATNLAVAFGVGQRKRTLLADLNSGLGNADLLLDLEPERVWFRYVAHGEGRRFVDTATEFNDHIMRLGPNPLKTRSDT